MAAMLMSGRTFKQEVVADIDSYIAIGHAIAYVLSFCSMV